MSTAATHDTRRRRPAAPLRLTDDAGDADDPVPAPPPAPYAHHLADFPPMTFEQIFERSASGRYESFCVTITPDVACALLDLNRNNRPLTPARLARYAEDMAAGRWNPRNAQTISLNVAGDLDNGQHRLNAIVKAGVAVPTLLVVGNTKDAFESIDKGKNRTEGDTLAVAQVAYSVQVAAALRLCWRYERGCLDSVRTPTPSETVTLLERHRGLVDSARWLMAHRRDARTIAPPSLLVFAHYTLGRDRPAEASRFFDGLFTGVGLEETSPVLQLRNRLLAMKIGKARVNSIEILAILIKAWNMFVANRPCRTLVWRSGGPAPEPFPSPIP